MTRWILLTLIALIALHSAPAAAQMACGERDSIVAKLNDNYGETRRSGGLAGPNMIFEIWASEATGTWTILRTAPNGITCIAVAGTDWWEDIPEPEEDPA